jgi:GNAT superfamily N-acetyltransferase
MAVTYHIEPWGTTWQEMSAHWKQHHAEVALDHAAVPLDIDLDFYHQMAAQNILHLVTVRDEGLLVGYHLSFIKPHVRYKSTLHAFVDVYYLAPAYRRGLTGYRLLQYVERSWQARGVKKAFTANKLHIDVQPLYERLGWRETERLYSKLLPEKE